ncbi:K+-H+ exchange-related [Singulisphaera sp. GP187]|uniref:hypothetical protein n=1 Tax=Singulisphaera sp. GP187 TaxID=1882752 RepID=UPI000926C7FC|nr:hypothetical protein [Singulisphaera sp. GP187]SIO59261.1 K+-H+ exchange-related [Singulisphaera sp. GP187]
MKIQLHLTTKGKAVFHAEKSAAREEHPPHHGLRGWIERKAQSLKTAWSQADRGPAGRVRAFWEKLQSRMPDDESMLARLRTASAIEMYHPATMSGEEAQAHWVDYMARCRRRHLPWLGFNILISPITLILAPLPGPNLIGYWFAYRAVKDALALLGLRHARDPGMATTYHPLETHAVVTPVGEFSCRTETNTAPFAGLAAGSPP